MLLRLESGRPVTSLVLDAPRSTRRSRGRPWQRTECAGAIRSSPPAIRVLTGDEATRFAVLLRDVLLGSEEQLADRLAEDAVGWAPNLSFGSRQEALDLVRQDEALEVHRFDVSVLALDDAGGLAEWQLGASCTQPLMLADDLLVESAGLPLWLAGVSIVALRNGSVAEIRTYYDDAAVLEQLVLAATDRWPRNPGGD